MECKYPTRSPSLSTNRTNTKAPSTQITDQDPLSGICLSELEEQPVDDTWIEDLYQAILWNNPKDLRTALKKFNARILEQYLAKETKINDIPPFIQAIICAINKPEQDYSEILTILINAKHRSINEQGSFTITKRYDNTIDSREIICTPLFATAANNRFDLANLLVSLNAKFFVKSKTDDSHYESLITYAGRIGDKAILKWLNSHQTTINKQAANEKTPLLITIPENNNDCCHCCCGCLDWLFGS